jgi:hypothetical protein
VALILLILDWKYDINDYKEFTVIIKMLAEMHFAMILIRYIANKLQSNGLPTWRIILNFIASVMQLTIIIISIGYYVKSFSPKILDDGSKFTSLPLGVWHMVNIY